MVRFLEAHHQDTKYAKDTKPIGCGLRLLYVLANRICYPFEVTKGPKRYIAGEKCQATVPSCPAPIFPSMAELDRTEEKPVLPQMASSAATNVLPEKGDTVA